MRDRGVPADDLTVLRYADYGCEAYGFALIVNPAFAAAKPEAVKAFLRAVIAGTRLAIKEPARAVDDVLTQMEGGTRDLELARLRAVIGDNILTDEVKRSGIGGIDPARFDAIGRSDRRRTSNSAQTAGSGGYFRRQRSCRRVQRPLDQLS